eukprot:CAMPEP_0184362262 /NCGR_PEP_ID=MMETSP1089-20130417/133991_1 /TAXON_ID=38269 ORGANISM="Gloeochaete wittrockiana, Strain SAG46.84" /NCGR_SAMPLE_ID=MMETSP1089 /ASSEMBLY_ACC=CAM_ASM_000445 /LENGTH=35 /DNA_ID= /DNA_START= /DNA_END= /DNA_ORIENTATION=
MEDEEDDDEVGEDNKEVGVIITIFSLGLSTGTSAS